MRHLRAAVLLLSCVYAACAMTTATQGSDDASRREFLTRVDGWLAARDAPRLAAAADADAWHASGRATLLPNDLWLPPAPIARIDPAEEHPRSPNEVLYRDGDGNKWRLRVRWDERNGWLIPVRPDPCQSGAAREGFRDLPERPGRGQDTAPAASANRWTPLECYPFKK